MVKSVNRPPSLNVLRKIVLAEGNVAFIKIDIAHGASFVIVQANVVWIVGQHQVLILYNGIASSHASPSWLRRRLAGA